MDGISIARLHMKKDNGDFTQEEVSTLLNNFLTKVMKSEKEKMMNDEMIFCPLMSQVQLGPGPVQNTVKPVAMQATCFKKQCGLWSLCPANKDSLITEFVQDVVYGNVIQEDETDSGIR